MNVKSPQSAGGKATAEKLKREARERYYKDPNICVFCGKVIEIQPNQRAADARVKKFCNHSCATKHRNKKLGYPKTDSKISPTRKQRCSWCGNFVWARHNRKYCDSCLRTIRVSQASKRLYGRVETKYVGELTKEELRDRSKNYTTCRNRIAKHARLIYANSGKSYKCAVCGYSVHVSVCHIKPVAEFAENIKIETINKIDNLVTLCPNHHWEFDNGLIDLKSLCGLE